MKKRNAFFFQSSLLCNLDANSLEKKKGDKLATANSHHTHIVNNRKNFHSYFPLPVTLKKPAFTLMEMLLALFATAILLAAIAPIVTKRYQESLNILGIDSTAANSAFLTYDTENGIQYTKGNAYTSLKQISPGVIEFTNKEGKEIELTLTLQGAGGGGGGYRRTGDIYSDSSEIQHVNSTISVEYPWVVPVGISNLRVTLQGAGGGGGAAYAGAGVEEFLLSSARNGNQGDLCIKRYNIGDIPSLLPPGANMKSYRDLSSEAFQNAGRGGILSGTTLVPSVASGAGAGSATNTCWYAKDKPVSELCGIGNGYSGCYRTLCTQDVAIAACNQLSPAGYWRLPTSEEMQRWRVNPASFSAYKSVGVVTADASDFCDYGGSGGATQCNILRKGCQGAVSGDCYPYYFWGSTPKQTFYMQVGNLSDTGSYYSTSYAASSRCVRSTSVCQFAPYHGAGGSSGGTFKNIQFEDLQPGDRLYFILGEAGVGAGLNDPEGSTTGGYVSWVYHQRETAKGNNNWEDVVKIWGDFDWVTPRAGGGSGGKSATTTAHGRNDYLGGCEPEDRGICFDGNYGFNWVSNLSTAGGASTYGPGADSADSTSFNGLSASYYGAGGAGGFAKDASNIGKGGNGGAAYGLIEYNIASTGSGGGAGGYYKNVKIKVPANSKLTFNIGKGGLGSDTSDAQDGENTTVVQNSIPIYTAQGGLGGKVTPILSNAVSTLAIGGLGGKIFEKTIDKSDPQTISETSGTDSTYTTGGNGGVSKSDDRDPAFGGCAQVDNPLSYSACYLNKVPFSAFDVLYNPKKGTAKGGGGGGGAGCDDTSCVSGADGAHGFITLKWQ